MNSDDLEEILGPRPFKSTELRNIDKFRQGFQKPAGAQAGDVETENPQQPPTPTPDGAIPGTLEGPGGSQIGGPAASSASSSGSTDSVLKAT